MIRAFGRIALGLALLSTLPARAAEADWTTRVDPELLAGEPEAKQEFMIELAERADLSAAATQRTRLAKTRAVVQSLRAVAQRTQPGLLAVLAEREVEHQAFWIANAISAKGDRADIAAIAQRPEVRHVHRLLEQSLRSPVARHAVAKEGEGVAAGVALVRAPEVWALGFRGQGVVVGDHDIGVQWDHPALKAQYRGWDGQAADHAYNWHNSFKVDPFCTDLAVPCDSHGHGTHTTGTMVGDDGEGNQVGMAPGAQWIACRSLLDPVVGVGTVPTYLECMEWQLAPYPQGDSAAADPAYSPDVVNNSWGCLEGCAPPLLKDVNDAIYAAGIVQVVSAGNDGDQCSTLAFPVTVYESSFTVGATDVSDQMAGFSSRGPVLSDLSMRIKPNVVAPGVDTISSSNDGGYASLSGTSMAAPHVAGLVALLMSAEPRLIGRVADIRTLIERTALPIPTTQVCGGTGQNDIPNNIFGFGRIDALGAVLGRPQLQLSAAGPGSVTAGQSFEYSANVSQGTGAKLDATGVVLTLTLPAGVSLLEASEAPVSTAPLQFRRASLAPGASWSVNLKLGAANAGAAAVGAVAEADQVSPTPGAQVRMQVQGKQASRYGGGLGLASLVLLGLAARRRRTRVVMLR